MRTTTRLTTTGLLGLALLAPVAWAAPAGAAETCRGEAATIVGTGDTVTGTEGRDVIVSGTADDVLGLGGDDVICLSVSGNPRTNIVVVDAGAGNDLVDTTDLRRGYYAEVTLGAGSDQFVGGSRSDSVHAGEGRYEESGIDTERDVISTGGGGDSVFSGSPGSVNQDVVRLGSGSDQLRLESPELGADAVVAGGKDADSLSLRTHDGDVTIDAGSSSFTSAAGTASYSSFEYPSVVAGSGTIGFRGTGGRDTFGVYAVDGSTPTLDIRTRGGKDSVTIEPATLTAASHLDTGSGRDMLTAASQTSELGVDLRRNRLTVDDTQVTAKGLEDVWLMAPTLTMLGDAGANELTWTGCDATLRGFSGGDDLYWNYDHVFETYEFDCAEGTSATMDGGDGDDYLRSSGGDDTLLAGRGDDTVLGRNGDDTIRGNGGNDRLDGGEGDDDVRGEAGRDTMLGGSGDDRLRGGPGRDLANGGQGRDRCTAERRRSCEG